MLRVNGMVATCVTVILCCIGLLAACSSQVPHASQATQPTEIVDVVGEPITSASAQIELFTDTGHSQTPAPTATMALLMFGDVPLPSGQSVNAPAGDVASGKVPLPPAWLIVKGKALPATFGNYTWIVNITDATQEMHHGDAIEPERMPWLATATVGVDAPVTLILQASEIKQVESQVRPWLSKPSYVPFKPLMPTPSITRNGAFAVVRLHPFEDASEQLLYVRVIFDLGNVDYYWRLRP